MSLTLCLTGAVAITQMGALAVGENTGSTGSVTITKHANNAAKAFAAQDYKTARDEYRKAIALCQESGMDQQSLEFYYGLYDVCTHSGEWDLVAGALEEIFKIDPAKKKQLGGEYGEALYRMKRYSDAIPVLKQALIDANTPMPKIALVVPPPPPEEAPKAPPVPNTSNQAALPIVPPPPTERVPIDMNKGDLLEHAKTFETAVRAECIVIATYNGYQKQPDISYYHPPIANYRISKILKGPPLNKDLPIRYEFHDRSKAPAPADWKFGADKMPEKGSEWLVFIPIALPRNGAFDTYQGNYGRQPATEENLNKIYALLEGSANR
jgi:tetratricopeptide (TPR) repeat protein